MRFMIESNISGYLYVFHVENDGPAKMIFPDARLQGGNNFIQAHVPREMPSSREEDPVWLVSLRPDCGHRTVLSICHAGAAAGCPCRGAVGRILP